MAMRGRRERDRGSRRTRRWPRSMGVATAAGALTLGLLAATPAGPAAAEPHPGVTASGNASTMAPVPLAKAGKFVGWGRNSEGQTELPAELQGVALRKVVAESNVTLALTADGRVVAWGYNVDRTQVVPADVRSLDVADIAAGTSYAGVVTRTGEVRVWGSSSETHDTALDVPAGLSGVKQLVFPGYADALALKDDGTVVGWGKGDDGVTTPPAGLKATAIIGAGQAAYALTEDGTVVAWGAAAGTMLPAETQEPGNVVAVTMVNGTLGQGQGMALLADDTIVSWGILAEELPEVGDERVVAFASRRPSLVLTEDGVFHPGGSTNGNPPPLTLVTPPEAAQGQAVAQFSVGTSHVGMIVTTMLRAAAPAVTGTPTVGATLTGTPGTFSADPDEVTNAWLADGQPIAGATGASLTLTADLVGMRISYRSTATKTGEEPVSSTSEATAPVAPVTTPKVASKTKVTKVSVAKKATKVTVTGKVTAARPPTGKAKVTIVKGKKTIVSKTVKVSAKGAVKLVVKKFAKLVVKKTKAKGKNGYRGTYQVTIAYQGNAKVKPSRGARTFKVRK